MEDEESRGCLEEGGPLGTITTKTTGIMPEGGWRNVQRGYITVFNAFMISDSLTTGIQVLSVTTYVPQNERPLS